MNIYKICNCKPQSSPESKFPSEYSGVIFYSNRSTFEKVIPQIQRGPDFMKRGVLCITFNRITC